jgi:hypothetical protein
MGPALRGRRPGRLPGKGGHVRPDRPGPACACSGVTIARSPAAVPGNRRSSAADSVPRSTTSMTSGVGTTLAPAAHAAISTSSPAVGRTRSMRSPLPQVWPAAPGRRTSSSWCRPNALAASVTAMAVRSWCFRLALRPQRLAARGPGAGRPSAASLAGSSAARVGGGTYVRTGQMGAAIVAAELAQKECSERTDNRVRCELSAQQPN